MRVVGEHTIVGFGGQPLTHEALQARARIVARAPLRGIVRADRRGVEPAAIARDGGIAEEGQRLDLARLLVAGQVRAGVADGQQRRQRPTATRWDDAATARDVESHGQSLGQHRECRAVGQWDQVGAFQWRAVVVHRAQHPPLADPAVWRAVDEIGEVFGH